MKRIHIVLAVLVCAVPATAQPSEILWNRYYGTTGWEYCSSVQQTSDGGYILAGCAFWWSLPLVDFWLVKTNSEGDSLWSRRYGGHPDDEGCMSVQQTLDGGYILAGHTTGIEEEGDGWVVKASEDGDSVWSRRFGGAGSELFYCVRQTSDSGYVLAGRTTSSGLGSWDFWLVKIDSNGDSLWSRTYGGTSYEVCYSVQQTSDGGYILAGETASFGTAVTAMWMVRTDANGDSLWSQSFGGNGWDACYSVDQTSDGGFILGGCTSDNIEDPGDFWLVKTDANGNSLWTRRFGGREWDEGYSVQQTSDGGYMLAGYTRSFGSDDSDFWLVKTDANGDSLWTRIFRFDRIDDFGDAHQTADGGYILAGTSSNGGRGFDFWLVKTGPELGAQPRVSLLPCQYSLHQNWPNPFNARTAIVYDLPRAESVSLQVWDILGRDVATLVDGRVTAGNHQVMFDGSALASGIYFYRLETGGFTATKKMVLLK